MGDWVAYITLGTKLHPYHITDFGKLFIDFISDNISVYGVRDDVSVELEYSYNIDIKQI